MRKGLTATVARRRGSREACVESVLHVALEDAVLDEHGALRRRALVVDVERAAALGEGAVVDHRARGRGDALADAPGEGGRALAVEIPLQAVAHGLVEQNAGPTRAQHDLHRAGGRVHGLEVDERLAHRLARIAERAFGIEEIAVAHATPAPGTALLAPTVLLRDHGHVQTHERAHVRRHQAVAARHQHHLVDAGEAGHDLLHARIRPPRLRLDALQELHLGLVAQAGQGVGRGVERHAAAPVPRDRLPRRARRRPRDRPRRRGGVGQRRQQELVGVSETGLLAAHGTHTDPLGDVV